MYSIHLIWSSAPETKPVCSRYSRLIQAGRTSWADPNSINLFELIQTLHFTWTEFIEFHWLMWSTASKPGSRSWTRSKPFHHILQYRYFSVLYIVSLIWYFSFFNECIFGFSFNPWIASARYALQQWIRLCKLGVGWSSDIPQSRKAVYGFASLGQCVTQLRMLC